MKHKSSFEKVISHLSFWVLIALIFAVLLGYFSPSLAIQTEWMGKGFVDLIKLFIGPIIFLTIVTGIVGMGNLKKVGRIGLKAVIYFEIVTTFALLIGIAFAHFFEPGKINKTGLPVQDASKYERGGHADFSDALQKDNFTLQV